MATHSVIMIIYSSDPCEGSAGLGSSNQRLSSGHEKPVSKLLNQDLSLLTTFNTNTKMVL